MTLWLSRLQLSPYSRAAMLLAADSEHLHQVVYGIFPARDSARLLFRVDPSSEGPVVLIQAPVEPDWNNLYLDSRDLRATPESKSFDPCLPAGTELSFRLLTRPVVRKATGKGNPHGPRKDLRTDQERLEWLHRKAADAGFSVLNCGLTILTMDAIKSDVPFRAPGGSFSAVRFDGSMVVTDSEKLSLAIASGIGIQKGFGFGLLSLGPNV